MEKLKKEFNIESSEKFVYAEWHKWDKEVEHLLSEKLNLRVIHFAYFIRKEDTPLTIMFDDIVYDMDPEYCRINAAPLNGAVFKRYNVEVHKFLNSLTHGTKAWK